MESISRDVSDLPSDQRQLFEAVLGQTLRDDQRVVVRLEDKEAAETAANGAGPLDQTIPIKPNDGAGSLPQWVTIFADMTDEEFAEIESAILTRASLGRSVDLDQ